MKILVIWGESLAKPGGGTTHCLGLVQGLRRAGHEVHVIAPAYHDLPETEPRENYHFIHLGRRSFRNFAVFQVLSVLLLPGWLRQYRPQAVYVRTCFLQGLQAILARLAGVPLVGEVDSIVDEEIRSRRDPFWWRYVILFLDHFNFRLASGSICVTRRLAEEVVRRGGNRRTTVSIHNGAETDLMIPFDSAEARRILHLPAEGVLAAFAGTFAPWAGLNTLMAAAEILTERRAALHLVLMGDGEMRVQVARWAGQPSLRNTVILLPRGPRESVRTLLNACDFVVLPFNDFGVLRFGLSSLKFWDAVSVGLPPLVPRQADLGDVLADLGIGAEYDPTGPEALADAILALACQPRRTLEQRNRTHQIVREKYSWDAVAKQAATFLETLVAGNKKACA